MNLADIVVPIGTWIFGFIAGYFAGIFRMVKESIQRDRLRRGIKERP